MPGKLECWLVHTGKTDLQYQHGRVSETLLASYTPTDPLQEFMLSRITASDTMTVKHAHLKVLVV